MAEPLSLALFGIAALWLAYAYAGYPLSLGVLAQFRRIRLLAREDYLPTVSVLIAARNEERDIGRTVGQILAWDYPADRLEVLVASDASDDRTDEIVRGVADSRVSLVRLDRRSGKARALNRLAAQARGEILYFTDANTTTDPAALRRMARLFADRRTGCVTGHTRNAPAGDPLGSCLYWDLELWTKLAESRLGSVLVCDGAIFAMRRSLFQPLDPELANDFESPVGVGYCGYWTLLEPAATAAEKDTNSLAEEFARRRRICAQGALAMWKLRRQLCGLRLWQCVSHKLLRWLTAIPLLLLLVSTGLLSRSDVWAALFALQLAFYLAALAGALLDWRGLLAIPCYTVLTAAAALAGVVDACCGRRFDLWDSPALSRGTSPGQAAAR
jgi:biofilm PGA synthesis N-glycosyltransferase PgaC